MMHGLAFRERSFSMILRLILAVALALLFPLQAAAQTPKRGGTLVVGMSQDLPGLDPHPSTSTITYQVLSLVYQGLVDFDRDLKIKPVLAESWKVSPDGKQWTFALRKGAKFHNGRPLTASDVKFSLDRILDPKTAARGKGALSIIESVQVVDPQTVRVHLTRASGAFLSRIAGTYQAILPPEAVQGPAFKPIGTGPFQLTEWKTNERVELKRFDGYWEAGLPYLDALTLKPVPDGTVRLTALKTGDAGFVQLNPQESLAELQAAPSKDYVVRTVKGGGGFSAIILNSRKPPFNDVRVRRAVALATDKKEVGLGVWRGFAQPINQMLPPGTPWFFAVPDRKPDVEQAKKLLRGGGVCARHQADAYGGTGGQPGAGGAGVPGTAHAYRHRPAAGSPGLARLHQAPARHGLHEHEHQLLPEGRSGRRVLPLLPLQGRGQRAVRRLREPGGRQASGGR
jgi:ABC-type transport system substrate-binding protein